MTMADLVEMPERLYHATRGENVEAILQEGLRPGVGRSGFLDANGEYPDANTPVVWMQEKLDHLAGLILAMKGPRRLIEIDTDCLAPETTFKLKLKGCHIYFSEVPIPAEALTDAGQIEFPDIDEVQDG